MLRTHRLGETSKVVVCYTETHGKVRLVAKGGRAAASRLAAALEPFSVSGVVFYPKTGRGLSIVSQADVERDFAGLRRDAVRMAHGSAVLELADRLISEEEPDPALFRIVEAALAEMDSADAGSLDGAFLRFAFRAAAALGYAASLGSCVLCGGPPGASALFAPRHGGLACGSCVAADPEVEVVGRAATAALADAAAGRESAAPSEAVADEAWEAMSAFLAEHTGRRVHLRSLDVLAQLRRAERAGRAD